MMIRLLRLHIIWKDRISLGWMVSVVVIIRLSRLLYGMMILTTRRVNGRLSETIGWCGKKVHVEILVHRGGGGGGSVGRCCRRSDW